MKTLNKGFILLVTLILFCFVLIGIASAIDAPEIEWEKTLGGSSWDCGNSIQQITDDGYIIVGSTTSYGAGRNDVYLIKTDASGTKQWEKTFGGGSNDYGNSIQQTTDGGYIIVGGTYSYGAGGVDFYLIKTDASGTKQWEKTFGGSGYDWGKSVRQTTDSGYIIVGGKYSFGAGENDVYLVKTYPSGTKQWEKTFSGSGYASGNSVQQTIDGGYIIVGSTASYSATDEGDVYLIKTDASGTKQWEKTFGGSGYYEVGNSIQQTTNGGYIVVGDKHSFDQMSDVYLIKTDASGTKQWEKTFGGSGYDYGNSVQQTIDGGYIIVGSTSGDVYLIKTGASGTKQWEKTFGGSSNDYGNSIQQTTNGGYIIVGGTYSFGGGNGDAYLIKLKGMAPPDLTLSPNDITFSPKNPVFGDIITVTATIHNIGEGNANNIVVRFTDENGLQFGFDQEISFIESGGTGIAETKINTIWWNSFHTELEGEVHVTIDPDNSIPESDETNNFETKNIMIGKLIVSNIVIPSEIKVPTSYTFEVKVKNVGLGKIPKERPIEVELRTWDAGIEIDGIVIVPPRYLDYLYYNDLMLSQDLSPNDESNLILENVRFYTANTPDRLDTWTWVHDSFYVSEYNIVPFYVSPNPSAPLMCCLGWVSVLTAGITDKAIALYIDLQTSVLQFGFGADFLLKGDLFKWAKEWTTGVISLVGALIPNPISFIIGMIDTAFACADTLLWAVPGILQFIWGILTTLYDAGLNLVEVFIHACEGAIELAYNLGLSVADLIMGLIEIADYYGLPIVIFHWDCPVDIVITDANGNVTSIENGIITEDIPGSKVITDGNSKTILLTENISTYEIQTKGTGNGTFSLYIANSNGENSSFMKFIDIPVDENSKAFIFFDTFVQGCQMDLDRNGDGIIDETLSPEIELIDGVRPLADAGFNRVIDEGQSIVFDGSNSIDIDGNIINWRWDFGDGYTDSGTLATTHVYCDNGIYTVTLTITDDDGKVGTDTMKVIVLNVQPTADAGPDQTVYAGDLVIFNGSATDPGCDDLTLEWEFGDGTNATGLNTTHIYFNKGNYTVTFTVIDDDSGIGNDTTIITVLAAYDCVYDIKEDAITELEALNTTDKDAQKDIDEAIKHINKSLEDSLWLDASRLDPKHGHKTFDEEKKAVKHLMKITEEKGKHEDPAIVDDVKTVIDKLTKADEQLAIVAINDAKNTPVQDPKKQDKVDKEIAKAEEELSKAAEEVSKGKPDKAIDHYKKAWEHAQHAIKHAQKLPK